MAQERTQERLTKAYASRSVRWAEANRKIVELEARLLGVVPDAKLLGMWEGQVMAFQQVADVLEG